MSEEKCCPDLGFLIVFPMYKAGGIPGTGHSAVAVVNGRTGELKGYDFGPDDHIHAQKLGYVRKLLGALNLEKEDCLPECSELSYRMKEIYNTFGGGKSNGIIENGLIEGVMYKMPPGSYEKSVAYAEGISKINEEYNLKISDEKKQGDKELPDSYHYKVHASNCLTFALSVLNGKKAGLPNWIDWPASHIHSYQLNADGKNSMQFTYTVQNGKVVCDGCCSKKKKKLEKV